MASSDGGSVGGEEWEGEGAGDTIRATCKELGHYDQYKISALTEH
jgi:hypothetical protein